MAKLKNIIKQLSESDYEAIYDQLIESNAEKSAYLLKSMREKSMSDSKVMDELEVNTNAYYTLRSRLNQKIEEYLLQQMENPRTDILKKVANINEILFTKKKAIAIATLKKLEKELLDYDLSNELTVVYKSLKKLHINSPDHFNYSQLYNQHVAYMLAVDKAEDLLAEYFKKYGNYSLSGSENDQLELTLLNKEMGNVCGLYQSHRLYVYQSCMSIFHRMFVEVDESINDDLEPIEDMLDKIEKIFNSYHLDSIYYHLKLVYEFLKLEYYNHYKVYRKAENFFEEVNESASTLISNYSLFTYPPQFLLTKIKRHNRLGNESEMYDENEGLFHDFECDMNDIPKYVTYVIYRALSCYYADKYDEAARWINNLLNEISLKNYPYAQLEVKVILALQYCLLNDYDLFNQLINSIQRQIRLLGKENCEHILIFTKILKTSINDVKKNKSDKIKALVDKMQNMDVNYFAPTLYVKLDEKFVNKLS
ncbi:hypothetical protein QQ008_18070 [Fulvivirgaceae bacterium BMA10]|uniref:Uncharacterized protein n=1 Tax=Splendidivirga corallicola TaxID=3051826 RepID=A0ABT8KRE3_9BACT|nr:hypothetical protein [Fulvivirgaceae bacterium BMA10]